MSKTFPAGGAATLKKIDELLGGLGVTIHEHCGLHGCQTTLRYRRARQEALDLLRFECVAYSQQLGRRKR